MYWSVSNRARRTSIVGWTVSLEDAHGGQHACRLSDVAEDGLFVAPTAAQHGLAPGQRVQVLIRSGAVQLHVGGEVRWVGTSSTEEVDGFGVKLDDMPNRVASVLGRIAG